MRLQRLQDRGPVGKDGQYRKAGDQYRGGDQIEPQYRERRIALQKRVRRVFRVVINRDGGADGIVVQHRLRVGDLADADPRAANDAVAEAEFVFDIGRGHHLRDLAAAPPMHGAGLRFDDAGPRRRPACRVAQLRRLPQDDSGDQDRDRHDHQPDDDLDREQKRGECDREAAGCCPPELLRQTVGTSLAGEEAERDQRQAEQPRDCGANAQRVAKEPRAAVGNRSRAAPDIGRQRALAFAREGSLHRLCDLGRLRDRFRARRRAHAEAGVAHLGLVGERFQARIGVDALSRALEGARDAGVVALCRRRELDRGDDARRRPRRHDIAHFPGQPRGQKQRNAKGDACCGRTRQTCLPAEAVASRASGPGRARRPGSRARSWSGNRRKAARI